MKTSVICAVVAATAVVPFTPAHADHGPQGFLCGFASITDPGTEGGDVQTGEIDGGPILVTGDGTITCSVQVGVATSDGTDAASATGGGNTVAYLDPTVVSYVSPADVPVFLCTTVSDATGTYYWDDNWGDWVSSADAATCSLVTSLGDPREWIDDILDSVFEILDPLICRVLAIVFPPQGDVPGVWDCPPYDS